MGPSALPVSVRSAIAAKTGSTLSLTMAWERVAEKALSAGVREARLILLIQLFSQARALENLVDSAGRHGLDLDAFFAELTARVDESDFALADWIAAFERVQLRVIQQSRLVSPDKILGYVQCSADFAASNEARLSLREVVEEMITKYGFEG